MESSFTWLDNSERDRQRAQEALRLFLNEETVRDELGLGVVSRTISDMLFPGTSTVQTRARYFLLVPWIYRKYEKSRTRSNKIKNRAGDAERKLIDVLCNGQDTNGVIGKRARRKIKRLPSNIYWNGLRQLGILKFDAPQHVYHRSLDSFYKRMRMQTALSREADDDLIQKPERNWHAYLPPSPDDFLDIGDLSLRKEEAEYLRDRLRTEVGVSDSLLGYYAKQVGAPGGWPAGDRHFGELRSKGLPGRLEKQVHHARCFSEVLWGAGLLYNLMLTELRVKVLGYDEKEYILAWEKRLGEWVRLVKGRADVLKKWDEDEFWELVREARRGGAPVFIKQWTGWVKRYARSLSVKRLLSSDKARSLVEEREKKLKGPRSKFRPGSKYLELWEGASKATDFGQMDFRWRNARRILQDIHQGLQRQED